jgi:lactate racemase
MRAWSRKALLDLSARRGNDANELFDALMKIELSYGDGRLPVDLPDERTTVIEPAHQPGLADERAALLDALDHPIGAEPLAAWIRPDSKICVVFTDITRATPNERIIPWLLAYLDSHNVPRENILLLNGLGTHRPNTRAELEKMLTPDVVANYRVLNHEPDNYYAHVQFGVTRGGAPVLINRHVAEAGVRIVTGFIEPHFFAGFSGGPKGIMPGVAHVETVKSNHGSKNIAHPGSAFGITDGNPIWEEMRDIALRVGPSFLLNVALNERREITGVFAGDLIAAHKAGIEFVRASAMQKLARPFDIVVTTNSGYPLDQNLYQGVKGMSAAARIVRRGGTIVLAAECREGAPAGSPFDRLLRSANTPAEILAMLAAPGFSQPEQWQAQIQALIQSKAEVLLHSSLADADVRAAHLTPCGDITAAVSEKLRALGPATTIAVLPQGPLTIPYLANGS